MRKKIISIVLALAMMLSLIPASAYAFSYQSLKENKKPKFNIVDLGDSLTNGYGFKEYFLEDGQDVRGFMQQVDGTYPQLLKKAYEDLGYNVNLAQLAGSALRPDDLDAILDSKHVDDDYTKRVYTDNGREHWFREWSIRTNEINDNPYYNTQGNLRNEEFLRKIFIKEIKKADLITYNLGANTFGTFFDSALLGDRYGDTDTTDDFLDSVGLDKFILDDLAVRLFDVIEDAIKNAVGEDVALLNSIDISALVELLLHGYVNFCYYFTKNIEVIRKLNPKADLVVMGIPNALNGIKVKIDSVTIPLDTIYGFILGLANTYMAVGSINCDRYYFAATGSIDLECFRNDIAKGKVNEVLKEYLLATFGDNSDYAINCIETPITLESIDEIGTIMAALDGKINILEYPAAVNFYLQTLFPNGMGISSHPNEEGHKQMYNEVMKALRYKQTGKDVAIEKIVGWMHAPLITKYLKDTAKLKGLTTYALSKGLLDRFYALAYTTTR